MAGAKSAVCVWKDLSCVVGGAWTLGSFHNLGRIIQSKKTVKICHFLEGYPNRLKHRDWALEGVVRVKAKNFVGRCVAW